MLTMAESLRGNKVLIIDLGSRVVPCCQSPAPWRSSVRKKNGADENNEDGCDTRDAHGLLQLSRNRIPGRLWRKIDLYQSAFIKNKDA
jgi:hypothetical protein